MSRIIKPGPRAYAAAFFILLMALALPFGCLLAYGEWLAALKAFGVLLAGSGLVVSGISRTRIVFSEDSIRLKYSIAPEQRVRFIDIFASRAQVLYEPNHPVCLHIFGDTGKRTEEGDVIPVLLLRLQLKPFRQQDVAWLLSQPEFRVAK
jgi:hypothetical protein